MTEYKSRKTVRLPGCNYAADGRYFVTMCTYKREGYLGKIEKNVNSLSGMGRMIAENWKKIGDLHPYITVDDFVIMPNHIHGILSYHDTRDYEGSLSGLSAVIRDFKAYTGREFSLENIGSTLWQRGYYEHIIRDDAEYIKIKKYIKFNPFNWVRDKYYPGFRIQQ